MPLIINKGGVAHLVSDPDILKQAIRDGARLADDDDSNYLEASESVFRVSNVEGFEEGCLGDRRVVVQGKGETGTLSLFRSYTIAVNPERDSPADAALALDDVYWHRSRPGWTYKVPCFYPSHFNGPGSGGLSFKLPMAAMKGRGDDRLEVRTREGIRNCKFSGIAAMLVGMYLTRGPVILTGFELSGGDAAGKSYEKMQRPAWECVAKLVDRVYLHPEMSGPLCRMFPKWGR